MITCWGLVPFPLLQLYESQLGVYERPTVLGSPSKKRGARVFEGDSRGENGAEEESRHTLLHLGPLPSLRRSVYELPPFTNPEMAQ